MAELINLHQADKHLKICREELVKSRKLLDSGKVGSDPELINLLWGAVADLEKVVREIMHNNRDGRGTTAPKSAWDVLRGG